MNNLSAHLPKSANGASKTINTCKSIIKNKYNLMKNKKRLLDYAGK